MALGKRAGNRDRKEGEMEWHVHLDVVGGNSVTPSSLQVSILITVCISLRRRILEEDKSGKQ